jgi:translation initiation factor 2 alpha subunit (eIF-2alpha)
MPKTRDLPLDEAKRIINADRNQEYGEPYENFRDIAEMMTVILRKDLKDGARVRTHQVAMTMMAVKMSRMTTSPAKLDTWVDIAGYVGAGFEAMCEEVALMASSEATPEARPEAAARAAPSGTTAPRSSD